MPIKYERTKMKFRFASKLLLYVSFLGIVLLTNGCALLMEGPQQKIKIHCEPNQGVTVLSNGKPVELKNGEITLDKKRDTHFVTFSKAGYHQSTISFNREVNPFWPVADLIWGPGFPVAWLIDWQFGAVYRIDPRDLHVVLRKEE